MVENNQVGLECRENDSRLFRDEPPHLMLAVAGHPVGVTVLEHQFTGASLLYVLDNSPLQPGPGSPVSLEPLEDAISVRFPGLHHVSVGPVGKLLKRLVAGSRVVEFGGIFDVPVPATLGYGPFLVQDNRRCVNEYPHERGIGPWQVKDDPIPFGLH